MVNDIDVTRERILSVLAEWGVNPEEAGGEDSWRGCFVDRLIRASVMAALSESVGERVKAHVDERVNKECYEEADEESEPGGADRPDSEHPGEVSG